MKLSIVPVTEQLRPRAEALSVGPGQEHFIETVAQCMQEADRIPDWEPVVIFDGETMIGFAMYGFMRCETRARVWFDRFLIDHRYQKQGYGRRVAEMMIGRLRAEFPGQDIYLSAYDDNPVAIRLYQSFGFVFNGEKDINGEDVMVLPAPETES